MSSDAFDVSVASGSFANGGGYDPTALQPALFPYNVDPSGVALSGPQENVFKGPAAGHLVVPAGTDIPTGQSWTVSPSSGAVLEPAECLDYHSCSAITVQGGGTLDLAPGTVVKSSSNGVGIEVAKGSSLHATGTSADPVVCTSINDDQVDGHSNGVSAISKPGPNAYGMAIEFDDTARSQLNMNLFHAPAISGAVFEYASTAVYLKLGGLTISRSDVAHDSTAIDVEPTTGPDYNYLGNLPCAPPWVSGITTSGTWFAPTGPPRTASGLAASSARCSPRCSPRSRAPAKPSASSLASFSSGATCLPDGTWCMAFGEGAQGTSYHLIALRGEV